MSNDNKLNIDMYKIKSQAEMKLYNARGELENSEKLLNRLVTYINNISSSDEIEGLMELLEIVVREAKIKIEAQKIAVTSAEIAFEKAKTSENTEIEEHNKLSQNYEDIFKELTNSSYNDNLYESDDDPYYSQSKQITSYQSKQITYEEKMAMELETERWERWLKIRSASVKAGEETMHKIGSDLKVEALSSIAEKINEVRQIEAKVYTIVLSLEELKNNAIEAADAAIEKAEPEAMKAVTIAKETAKKFNILGNIFYIAKIFITTDEMKTVVDRLRQIVDKVEEDVIKKDQYAYEVSEQKAAGHAAGELIAKVANSIVTDIKKAVDLAITKDVIEVGKTAGSVISLASGEAAAIAAADVGALPTEVNEARMDVAATTAASIASEIIINVAAPTIDAAEKVEKKLCEIAKIAGGELAEEIAVREIRQSRIDASAILMITASDIAYNVAYETSRRIGGSDEEAKKIADKAATHAAEKRRYYRKDKVNPKCTCMKSYNWYVPDPCECSSDIKKGEEWCCRSCYIRQMRSCHRDCPANGGNGNIPIYTIENGMAVKTFHR